MEDLQIIDLYNQRDEAAISETARSMGRSVKALHSTY